MAMSGMTTRADWRTCEHPAVEGSTEEWCPLCGARTEMEGPASFGGGVSERREVEADAIRAQIQEWHDKAEADQHGGYMRDEHRVGQAYAYERVLDLLDGQTLTLAQGGDA